MRAEAQSRAGRRFLALIIAFGFLHFVAWLPGFNLQVYPLMRLLQAFWSLPLIIGPPGIVLLVLLVVLRLRRIYKPEIPLTPLLVMAGVWIFILVAMSPVISLLKSDIDDLTLRAGDHFYYASVRETASDGVHYDLHECDDLRLFCKRVATARGGLAFVGVADSIGLEADGDMIQIVENGAAVYTYRPSG